MNHSTRALALGSPAERVRIGLITPSSNSVVEPITSAIVSRLTNVTAHFSRFRVTEISLDAEASAQFSQDRLLDASRLLADAKVNVIAWSGTSASWLGFDTDRALCRRITEVTSVPATTATLALIDALVANRTRRIGLVTPYTADVQARIKRNFSEAGFECVADRCLGISDNFSFAQTSEAEIDRMVSEAASQGPDAVIIVCTNLPSAHRVEALERSTGSLILDSTAITVRKALELAGVPAAGIDGWGRQFGDGAPLPVAHREADTT